MKALSIDAWLKGIGGEMGELRHYQAHLVHDPIYNTHYPSSSHTAAPHPSWGNGGTINKPHGWDLWLGRARIALGERAPICRL